MSRKVACYDGAKKIDFLKSGWGSMRLRMKE